MQNKRLTNIDLLKIICIFSVIVIHVSSAHIFNGNYEELIEKNFLVINFYNVITRFCVPCFIMISGMFLLKKDISIKTIYKKYILRILITYIIFGLLYSIYVFYSEGQNILYTFLSSYYHLWYLYLLIGLYVITPIIKKITNDKNLMIYFLILCLIFSSIIPVLTELLDIKGLDNTIKYLNINIPLGYVGYYVAGYYFSKYKVNNKVFYCLGILGFIINYTYFYNSSYIDKLYSSIFLLPGTVFESIAVFLFFNKLKLKDNYIISYISQHIMGIYLVHIFIMQLVFMYLPFIIYNYSIINILMISIYIFIASLLISIALKSIPFLKRIL